MIRVSSPRAPHPVAELAVPLQPEIGFQPPHEKRSKIALPRVDRHLFRRLRQDTLGVPPAPAADPVPKFPWSAPSAPNSCSRSPGNFPMQPGAGSGPVALHGGSSNSHHCGNFLQRKTGKETQFHNAALPWIDPGKSIEGIIERDDIQVFTLGKGHGIVQCEHAHAAATFGGAMAASIVHKNLTHKLSRNCKKVRTALPLREILSD